MSNDNAEAAGALGCTAFFIAMVAAWATHVIVSIMREEWFLLIAGALAFPVGIVHGVGIWFGVW